MAVNELKAGAILSYVSIAVNNIVGLLYTPYLLRMLGQNEFGLYSLVASVVGYLTILDLGFGNAIIRYTSKYRAEGKGDEQSYLFGMFIKLYCIIGLATMLIGCVFIANIDYFFGSNMTQNDLFQTRVMMSLMVLNIAFTFPMSIWGSIITAYEKFIFQKVINILRIVLNALVMVVLLKYGFKAITMVVVLTVFNFLTLFSNMWFCRKRLDIRIKYGKIDWPLLREIFAYSIWIFVAGIVDRIYWSTGQFVIGIYHAPAEIALFGVAVQLQALYSSFSFAISGVFFPKIVKMVTQNSDVKELSNLFIRVGRIQFYVMALVFTGFVLFGKKFILLWAGADYAPSFMMCLIIFSAILLSSIQTLGNNILQARGDVRFRAVSIFIVSLCAFGLCFPFAKYYAGLGCAIVIASGIIIGHIIILNWYYKVRIGLEINRFWSDIFKIALLPAGLCILGYFIIQRSSINDDLLFYILAIILYAAVYLTLNYLINFNAEEKSLVNSILKKINLFSK